jgi:hypothetical protein
MKMVPGFSKAIDQWVESLPKDPIGGCKAPGGFQQDVVKAGKLLAFRLISMSVYGDAFTENVSFTTTDVGS